MTQKMFCAQIGNMFAQMVQVVASQAMVLFHVVHTKVQLVVQMGCIVVLKVSPVTLRVVTALEKPI